jgi:hypothetical protein
MLNVNRLSINMMNVFMQSVIMLNVIMLNVVMLCLGSSLTPNQIQFQFYLSKFEKSDDPATEKNLVISRYTETKKNNETSNLLQFHSIQKGFHNL